ncbi:MAG: glutamate/tyrosine decarboxylase-like PLP-dependent enzyme, partial [Paraglaciecola sp.]
NMFEQNKNKELLKRAQTFAFDYLDASLDREVYPTEQALNNLKQFDEDLPLEMSRPQDVLNLLGAFGSPATTAQTGGRYFGFVNGNALPIGLASRWLADIWDQNSALYVMSPIAAKLESLCQTWLRQLFDLPQPTVAGFVSGTSVATLSGLAAARYRQMQKLGWDINLQGLYDAPKIRLIMGRQTHGTVAKAISLLGMGQNCIEWVECDDQGRMLLKQLPELDQHCILVLQAGNVNSGAFDDFTALCDAANTAGAWTHIDGAFGLWAAASESFSGLTRGINLAQSWSVDGHKTLNTPYDCGIVLCVDPEALTAALHQQGSYIQYSEQRDGLMYTPEMSRRARGVELWACMKYLGKAGMAELVEQLHHHAQLFATLLGENGFTILNDVVFNQLIVSCGSDQLTQATLENIQGSGECWCGGSSWQGQKVIRVSVCSWATTEQDVQRSVKAFVRARSNAK